MSDIEYKIRVMQGFAEGKEIECKEEFKEEFEDEWHLVKEPAWDWRDFDYRIKPEPPKSKIVPYESAEEFLAAMKGHGKNVILKTEIEKGCVCYIEYFDNNIIRLNGNGNFAYCSYWFLWKHYTYKDGTPCGKEVKE